MTSRRQFIATSAAFGAASILPVRAQAPTTLTVGYQKVGHLAPIVLIEADLASRGVALRLVEFARYADARTALLAGSLDLASVGPADLAIALANGATNVVGIMGVGGSPKYVIARTGTTFNSWDDIRGKRIAIAPGSAVWFQFAATLVERGIPYNSFTAVNIQGGGANFNQALQRGEVDAIVTWEPFESIPIMQGYGFAATNLDYSQSRAVGAELGMFVATRTAATEKRAALDQFVRSYIAKQRELAGNRQAFADAVARLTGLDAPVSMRVAEAITLGAVITPDQIRAQARAFAELGVITRDVSGEIERFWDPSFVQRAAQAS